MIAMDRAEWKRRAKALSEEEKAIAARYIPTDMLEQTLRARDEFCTDIIRALIEELNKIPDNPTIQDKERAISECKAILKITDVRVR